jgi:hypothetical protein
MHGTTKNTVHSQLEDVYMEGPIEGAQHRSNIKVGLTR